MSQRNVKVSASKAQYLHLSKKLIINKFKTSFTIQVSIAEVQNLFKFFAYWTIYFLKKVHL